jgi:hypothetical protein
MHAKLLFVLLIFGVGLTERGIAAETWGASLFKIKRHDFGRVALGADAEFRFELTNIYDSDIKLLNVRSSCTCSSAKFSTSLLKPGETGAVIVRFNTSGQHLRDKSAVLTVQLKADTTGAGRFDTVQLSVSGYIRPDVVLTPGSIEFGSVPEGATAQRTLQLEYSGRSGWALTKAERSQPFVYAQAEETRREQGRVVYTITAALKENAPAGYFKDVLRFTTNELKPGKSEPIEILVPVQGVVSAPICAKPSPILIGVLAPDETVTKSIVIRSETPFRITKVSASDNRFRFAFANREGLVQLITVSFSAKKMTMEQPQDITDVIRISTDNPRQNMTLNAFVRVVP